MSFVLSVYGSDPEDLCAKLNDLGVSPISIHPVSGTKRVVAYYLSDKLPEEKPDPKAKAPEPEAPKDQAAYDEALGTEEPPRPTVKKTSSRRKKKKS